MSSPAHKLSDRKVLSWTILLTAYIGVALKLILPQLDHELDRWAMELFLWLLVLAGFGVFILFGITLLKMIFEQGSNMVVLAVALAIQFPVICYVIMNARVG